MRSLLRPFATLLMAVGVATCSDSPAGPRRESPAPSNGIGREAVAFAPVFSKAASATSARLPDFGISYDRVRIVLVRPLADTVKDTTIVFTPGSADDTLELDVEVRSPTEVFNGVIDYANAAGVVFHGEGRVQAHPANQPAPTQQLLVVDYVGPGSHVAHLDVSPNPTTVLATETTKFIAIAVDSSGATIAVPVSWSVSDPSIASISRDGLLVPAGKRGTVTVTATTPTNVSNNASVTVVLPAASIALVSGGGQTGKIGAALAAPAVVRVLAVDGVGVAGVSVNFGAPVGGSIGASSVTTGADGDASTSMKLGTTAGPQGFVASTGSFSVAIPEVAMAGDPATIAAVSGGGQSDTVRHTLKGPLVAKVSDSFGNPVPGAVVSWTRTAGTGTLAAAVSTTGTDGLASVGYTFGTTAGSEAVSATVVGAPAGASFTMTALPAAPSGITIVSGADQTGTAGAPLSAPIVVKVVDASGNSVFGAPVSWSSSGGNITAGITPTGVDGLASNTFTLGKVAGAFTVAASVSATASVTTNATAVAGAPALLVWKIQPTTTAAGSAFAPALQVAIGDANGNVTTSTNAISLTLAGGTAGAHLTGTTSKAAAAGVATFDDLKLDLVGSGYTLVATGTGITPTAPSSSFAVVAGSGQSPTQLLFVPASTSIVLTAGVAPTTPVALKTADVNGIGVAGIPVTISLARASDPQNILTHGTSSSDANGLINDVTSIIGSPATAAGTYVITAKSTSIAGASVSLNVTVQTAAAAKLAIVTQPADAATSGAALSRQPVVQVQDAFGNATSAGTLQVTATPSAGTASGNVVAAGTTTGTATFSALTLVGTGNVTLTFSAPGMTSVTSAPVSLANTVPTQLLLDPATPTTFSYVAGVTPTSPPFLKVLDIGNAPVSGVPVRVVLTKVVNSAPDTVADVTVNSDGTGHVTFLGTLPTTATTYTATATSTSIAGASVTGSVTIQPAAAANLIFISQPTTMVAGVTSSVTVQVQDQFANVVSGSTNSISVAKATGPGTLTVSGPATAPSGNAAFSISFNQSGTYTLAASATPSLTPATSSAVTVSAGTATQMLVTTGTPTTSSFVAGGSLATTDYPSVTLLDANNNPAANAGTVTFSVTAGTGVCSITSGTVSVNASGVAVLPNLTASSAGSCTVHAVSSIVTGTTYDFNVIVAPSTGISWLGQSSTSFADAANWRGSIVPGSSDAIFIPRYSRYAPALTGNRFVGGVTVEALGTLDLGGAADTLTVSGNVATNVTGTITNGVVKTTGSGTVEGKLPGFAVAGTTSLSGRVIATAVKISSGSLDLAGQQLIDIGAFATTGTGVLKMLAATPSVNISGDASFDGGSESGLLTQGAMYFGGNFTQSHTTGGSSSSFAPSNSLSVYFDSPNSGAQTVSFDDPEYSFFHNVVAQHSTTFTTRTLVNNAFSTAGSGTVVTFSSTDSLNIVVVGTATTLKFSQANNPITGSLDVLGTGIITNTGGTIGLTVGGATNTAASTSMSGVATLTSKSSTFPQINGAAPSSTVLTEPVTLTQTSVLSGPLVLQNSLTAGGYTVSIGGSLSVTGANGKLIMRNANDHVTVSGNATFDGASTSSALTAGLLEITGNVSQQSDVSQSSFVAGTAHTTKLTGTGAQSVNFANPTTSHFYNLTVTNSSLSGVTITSIVDVNKDFTVTGSAKFSGTHAGGGTRLIVDGAISAGASTDLGGLDSLQVTSNTFPIYSNITASHAPDITVLTGSNVALAANATVAGGLGIGTGGSLSIGTRTLTISDSLLVNGNLDMSNVSGVVAVSGLVRFRGGSSTTGIQAGTLRVAGDLFEEGTVASFAPASGFLVQLNGSSLTAQQVSFWHPGATLAHFANLEIDNASAGVSSNTDFYVAGNLEQKGRLAIRSGTATTVDGIANFGNGHSATTDISGTLSLATANFYMGSTTTGPGTLNVPGANCHHGSISGGDLFVGTGGLFNLTSCIGSGISP